jgi:hypothetical protein|tara:strand:+ start:7629 stop:9062 length:1434 start_codon:yes stop_codon:yes gene_type:complete
MIKYYEGLPGAGKSHGAMINEVLSALYFNRMVITNLNGLKPKYIKRYLDKYHKKNRKRLKREYERNLKQNLRATIKYFKSDDYEKKGHRQLFSERRELRRRLKIVSQLNFPVTQEEIEKSIFTLNDLPADPAKYKRNPERYGETYNVFKVHDKMPWKNAVFIIDEVQKFFNKKNVDAMGDDQYDFLQWIGEHRHFGYDIIFISQTRDGIDPAILARIHVLYSYRKQDGIGLDNYYLEEVLSRVKQSGAKQFEVAKARQKKYDPDVLKCYDSVRHGAQQRMNVDKKAMIFNVKTFIGLIVFIGLLVIPTAVYWVYKHVFDNDAISFNASEIYKGKTDVEHETTAKRVVRDSNGNIVENKNGQVSTENVSVENNAKDSVVKIKHPMVKYFSENTVYCPGDLYRVDFPFSEETVYNKENLLQGYHAIIEVVSVDNKLLFRSDLNDLITKYHFEIIVIDSCMLKLRYKDIEFDIYPSVSLV